MLYVLNAAFLSREVSADFKNYLLRPFWSYRLPMKFIRQQIVREIIANVLVFIPIGFLAPFTVRKKKILCGLCTGFFFSFLIEILQLLTHKGFSEFDDLFHNTLGTLLGCGAYFLLQLFIRIIHKKNDKEKI
jgi:glycopeptide antibiotics resistance protein